MGIKSKIKSFCLFPLRLLSAPVKKTIWYKNFFVGADHETYPDNVWYRKHDERNFDLVNLGSSGGKWAFDYSDTGILAMNWAQQPQTLLEDFNLLRNYHSILKKNGIVLITIMPFTSLNKSTGVRDAMKYLKIDAHEPIQPNQIDLARKYARYPILMGFRAVKETLKHILGKECKKTTEELANEENNSLSESELEQDAASWISGWKKQFGILDMDAPLTECNMKGRTYRIALMRQLVDFCVEREYKPVFVIPPITKYLLKYFTPTFENIYIHSFLKDVERNVLLLDYSRDHDFEDTSLFFNSFFLNKRGAKKFTLKVLNDLGMN